ncbi:hypothetical protein Tco_0213894 [Tanacetum coccineum]
MDSSTGDKTLKRRPWEGSGKKSSDKRDRFTPYKEPNLVIFQSLKRVPGDPSHQNRRKNIQKASQNSVQGKRYIQILKRRTKQMNTQLEEWITLAIKAKPVMGEKEEPILMIRVINNPLKRKELPRITSVEETIFPPIQNRAPYLDPILISVLVYGRQVGRVLLDGGAQKLVKLLRDNANIFAWKYSDMTGIPRTLKIGDEIFVTEHNLNEDKKITPVQQKKRRMAPE